jgi:hypothetical protein
MLDALEREQRPWPLDPILIGSILLAFILGLRRGVTLDPSRDPPSNRTLTIATSSLAVALLVILVLRQVRPP